MLNVSLEKIYQGLFAQVQTANNPKKVFTYFTRVLRNFSEITLEKRPALMQVELPMTFKDPSSDILQEVILSVEMMIIADVKSNIGNENNPPISVLNTLIDAVLTTLRPSVGMVTGQQTLGGLVQSCWVEGQVFKDSGDSDGTAVALIPVKLLVPA